MLVALTMILLGQSPGCEFPPRHWEVQEKQFLQLADGTGFATVDRSQCSGNSLMPWASGFIDSTGVAAMKLDSRGFSIAARVNADVYSAAQVTFDDRFVSGPATRLTVLRANEHELSVIPARRADLIRDGEWTPRSVRCADLRFAPTTEVKRVEGTKLPEGTAVHRKPDGPIAFTVGGEAWATARADHGRSSAVKLIFTDGASLQGWVDRQVLDAAESDQIVGIASFSTCCGIKRPRPVECDHALILHARSGDRVEAVGAVEKGTQFDIDPPRHAVQLDPTVDPEWAVIVPRDPPAFDPAPAWEWVVKRGDLAGCVSHPAAH